MSDLFDRVDAAIAAAVAPHAASVDADASFPSHTVAAFRKAWDEVAKEQSEKSPEFKKAWDSLTAFRSEFKVWKENAYLKE